MDTLNYIVVSHLYHTTGRQIHAFDKTDIVKFYEGKPIPGQQGRRFLDNGKLLLWASNKDCAFIQV